MSLVFLALSLTLHGTPKPDAPVRAYMSQACPEQEAETTDDGTPTTAGMRNAAGARVDCLKKAMDRELDAFLVPLKEKDPAAFKTWMALQADFNRWRVAVCELYERTSGNDGSMAGFGELSCAQEVGSHRAWFAKLLAAGDLKPFWTVVDALREQGQESATGTVKMLAAAKAAGADDDAENPLVGLEPKELKAFEKKLAETNATLKKLAQGQCKALKDAPAGCEDKLVTYFRAVSRM
jgi:hypothetical protein